MLSQLRNLSLKKIVGVLIIPFWLILLVLIVIFGTNNDAKITKPITPTTTTTTISGLTTTIPGVTTTVASPAPLAENTTHTTTKGNTQSSQPNSTTIEPGEGPITIINNEPPSQTTTTTATTQPSTTTTTEKPVACVGSKIIDGCIKPPVSIVP
jgi:cytoskeletal protein RodZ